MDGSPVPPRRKLPLIHLLLLLSLACWAVCLANVIVNLLVTPRLSRSAAPVGAAAPRVSIVVPARDEEREIGAAVGSLLSQDYPDYEVIVVNDRSTDRTGEILAALPDPQRRLRVVAGSEPPSGWLGKPHALALGAREATGELLLFVDADVHYHPLALAQAAATIRELQADFLCLLPRLEGRGFWENVLMPYVIGSFFLGTGFLANTDWPRWFAVGGGAGNLIRREAYDRLGGHEALKNSVVDDVRLAFAARAAGFRTRAARAEDRVCVRMYRGFREVWNGFSKNTAYVFNGLVGVLLLLLTAVLFATAILPPAVLLAAAAGIPVPRADIGIAAGAAGLLLAARVLLALALRDPVWPALFHPFMAVAWAGMIGRSLYYRIVRRTLTWRGREFDARAARF
ncbi:MAG TPA: glycosyltransferase [Thermoanaerobaculia bacterium]|nr:glycosyltransferase [Thermoanaerobaculia bacterium]